MRTFAALLVVAQTRAFTAQPAAASRRPASPTALRASYEPKGSGLNAIDKTAVAVVGAGGSLGATVFGCLQLRAQTFDAGLRPPTALITTVTAANDLNRVLGGAFVLAFAGEDLMAKVEDPLDVAALSRAMAGAAVVVLADAYALNLGSKLITAPGTKGMADVQMSAAPEAVAASAAYAASFVQAAAVAEAKHVVVVSSNPKGDLREMVSMVEAAGLKCTAVRPAAKLVEELMWNRVVGLEALVTVGTDDGFSEPSGPAAPVTVPAYATAVAEIVVGAAWTDSRTVRVSCASGGKDARDRVEKLQASVGRLG